MTEMSSPTPEQVFLDQLLALNTDRLFVNVELERILVNPAYQRKVSMERVRKMARVYDPDLMGVLVCSVRPEGVFVIDGQHRLELARLLGHPTIRCELRVGLTVEQEANIFYHLDTARKELSSNDGFRALLVAKNPDALAIKGAIERAGLRASPGRAKGGVRAYKTLIALKAQYGIGHIQKILNVLGLAWHDVENPAPSGILDGMAYFLEKYPEVNQKELARTLREHTNPIRLNNDSRSISGSMTWSSKTSMARAILAVYNYKRSANRLDDLLGESRPGPRAVPIEDVVEMAATGA